MIRTEQAHIPFFADTDPGMSGKNNEDSYAVTAFRLEDERKTPALLAVLSDGIGGHRAGEVASRIAVDVISHEVGESDGSNPPQAIKDAISKASDQIYDQAEGAEKKGMGATCSIAFIIGNRLYSATVGDSRLYLVRNSQITQLSKDHTWIQEALDAGLIQPDQVEGHPNAHVIRRYLGGAKPPAADLRIRLTGKEMDAEAEANQGMQLAPGDQILLCSDGLTDLVKDSEVLEALQKGTMQSAVRSLIDLANERGGHDNITIAVLSMPSHHKGAAVPMKRSWVTGCLIALVLGAVAGGVALGWMYRTGRLDTFLQGGVTKQTPTSTRETPPTSTPLPAALPALTGSATPTYTVEPSITPRQRTVTATATRTRPTDKTASPTGQRTATAGAGTFTLTVQVPGETQVPTIEPVTVTISIPTSTFNPVIPTSTVEPPPAVSTPTRGGIPTWEKPTPKPLPTWEKPTPKPLPTWDNPFD